MSEWLGWQPPPPGTPINEAHWQKQGLVGYWRLNDPTAIHGSRIVDSSGYGNHGTLSTGDGSVNKSVIGKFDKAVMFDGTNDQITINDVDNLSFVTGGLTISVWVNYKVISNSSLVDKYNSGLFEYILGITGGNLYFWVYDNVNVGYRGRYCAYNLSGWHNMVATYDGGRLTTSTKIYIDGRQSDTNSFSGGTFVSMRNTSREVGIGRYTNGHQGWFSGTMSNVCIYKRDLSDWEVKYSYQNPFAMYEANNLVVGNNYIPNKMNYYKQLRA